MKVFFYGLFMDASLLMARGLSPVTVSVGHVEGYALRIGRRAAMVPEVGARTHGVLMALDAEEVAALYADESVADYVPEPVSVTLPDGRSEPAVCYTLPADRVEGANPEYARSLLELATALGLPPDHLRRIREQGSI